MKRLLVLALITCLGWQAHAQGTFTFSNLVPAAGLDQPVFDAGGAARLVGANFVAAIFLDGVQLGGVAQFGTGERAGYWDVGPGSMRTVPGKFQGEEVAGFVVIAWDSSKGNSYIDAYNAGGKVGGSRAFHITLGGPARDSSLPDTTPGLMLNFETFGLNNFFAPEPSVVALGAVGAAVILTCRRRQKPKATGGEIKSDS